MSKASKQRDCPAVGRLIPISECVASRHNPYACPATCPHDPFAPANYSRLLELEGKVNRKSMDYLMEHAPDRRAMDKSFQQASSHPSIHSLHAWFEWNLFYAPGADGLTSCQRREKTGLAGLKSDQQLLLRAKMQTRVALLQIHRVLDGERVEAVDLFAPGTAPMVFQDRGLAGVAVRFACALTWIYPLPHFWRLSGTAVLIPEMSQFPAEEIVTEIVGHLGGSAESEAVRRWLAEHFVRFDNALQATARLRRMKMFAGMDARFGKAVYELKAPFAECRQRLDELPDVEPDQLSDGERQEGFADARVWFAEQVEMMPAVPQEGRAVLGRVLLGQAHWRLEAIGGDRFAQLRRQFEKCLGQRVQLTGERLDDLGAAMAAKEPTVDESLVPPRLLEEPQKILLASSRVSAPHPGLSPEEAGLELMHAADRAFLDDHVPALDHRTPREAARDPALRPKLIRLLKQRVRMHDEHNLRHGRTDDINWLLRELGANEILFDPPPWRTPPPEALPHDDQMDDGDLANVIAPDPNLPPAPPLPPTPFDTETAAKRLEAAVKGFSMAADAEEALCASGSTLIDDCADLTVDMLSDEEFSFSVVFLLQAWFALVPPGHRAPALTYQDLEAAFQRSSQEIVKSLKSGSVDRLMDFGRDSVQPGLMLLLTSEIMQSGMNAPKKIRPTPESLLIVVALVRAVVDELDASLRRGTSPRV
jgi:hypothetical protein